MTDTLATPADFMATICERPADDLPRLQFADWLDENGDPDRAEFIRVQCELARLNLAADEYRNANGPRVTVPRTHEQCREWKAITTTMAGLRRRETELWVPPLNRDMIKASGLVTLILDGMEEPTPGIYDAWGIVRRGFVAELRGTAAALLGGVCERCRGTDWFEWEDRGGVFDRLRCDHVGTGRTIGLARQVMRTWEACGRCGGTGWADVGYVTEGIRVRHGRPQDKCKHCTDGRILRPLPPGCQPVQVCCLADGLPIPIPTDDDRPVTWQWKNERGDLLYAAHAPPDTHGEWHTHGEWRPTQRVVGRVVGSVLLPEFGPGVEWVLP